LWESARDASDPFRRFIYLYQILEYAAFYFVQDNILNKVKRILKAPETPSNVDDSAHAILESLIEDRMSDEAKIVAIMKQVVDSKELWKEIEPNKDFFSQKVQFDGGLTIDPLLKEGWGVDDFTAAWTPKFPDTLRRIRNALVHSREARMIRVIAPTHSNYVKLRRYTAPLSIAAAAVMVYREL